MPSHLIGVSLAILSAIIFGGSDYSGGAASRKHHPFQVLVVVGFLGIVLTALLAVMFGEPLPNQNTFLWGGLSGIVGFAGLVLLYKGLAGGNAAIVSPAAGVVGATLPAIFSAFTSGLPGPYQLAGFACAAAGILLVTLNSSAGREHARRGLLLGVTAGLNFGLFFIFLAEVDRDSVFSALCFSRIIFSLCGLFLLRVSHLKFPSFREAPYALAAGLLDPFGNALYMFASHFTRMDVAAMLSSLYPAGTVFLSRIFMKEHISRLQWAGVALCMLAIALISQ